MAKKNYSYHKEHGICVNCCKSPAVPGKTECEVCAGRRRGKEQRKYNAYKDAGICIKCHRNPALQGKTQCGACAGEENRKAREDYNFYKSIGICVACHKYTAAPGRTRCEMCGAKEAERNKKTLDSLSREEKKELNKKHYEAKKKKEDERRSMGLCVKCGRPQAGTSSRLCLEHLLKERRKCARQRQAKKMELSSHMDRNELPSYGICYKCCKNPVMEGKKLCEACYESNLRAIEIARSHTKYWREQNRLIFMKASI